MKLQSRAGRRAREGESILNRGVSVLNPLGSRLLRRSGPSATSGARRVFIQALGDPLAAAESHSARTRCRAFCSQVESPGVAQMRRGENCILQPGGITWRRTNAARGKLHFAARWNHLASHKCGEGKLHFAARWNHLASHKCGRENCIFQSAACRLLLQIVCICNKNIRHGRWHHLVTGRNQQARIALWGARRGRRHHHLRHACGARANDP